MKDLNSIQLFKRQSTWALLGLGIVTYGVYYAHYIQKQTIKINKMADDQERISIGFVNSIMILSIITLVLFIWYLIVEEGHPVESVLDSLNIIWIIMIVIWGFKARDRINSTYEITPDNKEWFSGLWTFLFSPLYFNYKINRICEESVE